MTTPQSIALMGIAGLPPRLGYNSFGPRPAKVRCGTHAISCRGWGGDFDFSWWRPRFPPPPRPRSRRRKRAARPTLVGWLARPRGGRPLSEAPFKLAKFNLAPIKFAPRASSSRGWPVRAQRSRAVRTACSRRRNLRAARPPSRAARCQRAGRPRSQGGHAGATWRAVETTVAATFRLPRRAELAQKDTAWRKLTGLIAAP